MSDRSSRGCIWKRVMVSAQNHHAHYRSHGISSRIAKDSFRRAVFDEKANASKIAGLLTPIAMMRKLTPKDALFGSTWMGTVAYFAITGYINSAVLLVTLPLLLASIAISRWSGVSFHHSDGPR